jgi:hypothetical protein
MTAPSFFDGRGLTYYAVFYNYLNTAPLACNNSYTKDMAFLPETGRTSGR